MRLNGQNLAMIFMGRKRRNSIMNIITITSNGMKQWKKLGKGKLHMQENSKVSIELARRRGGSSSRFQ